MRKRRLAKRKRKRRKQDEECERGEKAQDKGERDE
jgi:hypothetical protein